MFTEQIKKQWLKTRQILREIQIFKFVKLIVYQTNSVNMFQKTLYKKTVKSQIRREKNLETNKKTSIRLLTDFLLEI